MLVDEVVSRLDATVPDLSKRIEGAAELAALVRDGNFPQVMPAGFVLPLGLRGQAANAATGIFRQETGETVGVVLFAEAAGDGTGALALPTIETLADGVIAAIVGWAPGNQIGVFRLGTARLVSLTGGVVVYQVDFIIQDQLRINT